MSNKYLDKIASAQGLHRVSKVGMSYGKYESREEQIAHNLKDSYDNYGKYKDNKKKLKKFKNKYKDHL
jgi:hypothetical protein